VIRLSRNAAVNCSAAFLRPLKRPNKKYRRLVEEEIGS
jgi:hypothetical protein